MIFSTFFSGSNRKSDNYSTKFQTRGIKWKFYIFSTVYRNISFNNYFLSAFALIFDIFITSISILYPVLIFFRNPTFEVEDNPLILSAFDNQHNVPAITDIFCSSIILNQLTPTLFSTNSFLILLMLLFIISLVIFVICLFNPHLIRYFRLSFLYLVHTVIFFISSGVVGYAIFFVYNCYYSKSVPIISRNQIKPLANIDKSFSYQNILMYSKLDLETFSFQDTYESPSTNSSMNSSFNYFSQYLNTEDVDLNENIDYQGYNNHDTTAIYLTNLGLLLDRWQFYYRYVLCISFLFLYSLYFIFFMFLIHSEAGSLIKPNVLITEWYQGSSHLYPFIILITLTINFHTQKISIFSIRVALYSFQIVFFFIQAYLSIYRLPYMNFFVNCIFTTRSIVILLYSIFAIFYNIIAYPYKDGIDRAMIAPQGIINPYHNSSSYLNSVNVNITQKSHISTNSLNVLITSHSWNEYTGRNGPELYLGTIPASSIALIYSFTLVFVYLLIGCRTRNTEKILNQLILIRNPTKEHIATILASLKNENQLQLIIKAGLSRFGTGGIISSNPFLQYCIEKYPNSPWIFQFVIFIYSCLNGTDPMTYRLFLHLMSLDKTLNRSNEMYLFQSIYSTMQIPEETSPLITDYLHDYRNSFILLNRQFKEFWDDLPKLTSKEEFRVKLFAYIEAYLKQYSKLLSMKSMFPYSPQILIECSLFESDWNYNFVKASKFYNNALYIKQNKEKSLSSFIFEKGFVNHFPCFINQSDSNNNEKTDSETDYKFISMKESIDFAQKQPKLVMSKEEPFTQVFSIKKENLLQHQSLFFFESFLIVSFTVLLVIIYLFLFFLHFRYNKLMPDECNDYYILKALLTQTIQFRENMVIAEYDIFLLKAVQNEAFDNIHLLLEEKTFEDHPYYHFILNHLQTVHTDLASFNVFLSRIIQITKSPSISGFDGDFFSKNIFQSLYIELNRLIIQLLNSNKPTELNPDILKSIIQSFSLISNDIYQQIVDQIDNGLNGLYEKHIKIFIPLIGCDFIIIVLTYFILNFLISLKISKLLAVMKIIQPSIIESISNSFNSFLHLTKNVHVLHNSNYSTLSRIFGPSTLYSICIVILTVCPVAFTLKLLIAKNQNNDSKLPPSIIPFNDDLLFVYHNLAVIEYLLLRNQDTSKYFNESEYFSTNMMCIHTMFKNITDFEIHQIDFYEEYSINRIGHLIQAISFISFCVFILFLVRIVTLIKIVNNAQIIFYSIPRYVSQSNPILSLLFSGDRVSKKFADDFSTCLKVVPSKIDFFCTFFLSDQGEIVNVVGNQKVFSDSHTNFANLCEIQSYIKNNAYSIGQTSITSFFIEKSKKPIYLSIKGKSVISIKFNSQTELFIKDESDNTTIIRHMGRIDRLIGHATFLENQKPLLLGQENDVDLSKNDVPIVIHKAILIILEVTDNTAIHLSAKEKHVTFIGTKSIKKANIFQAEPPQFSNLRERRSILVKKVNTYSDDSSYSSDDNITTRISERKTEFPEIVQIDSRNNRFVFLINVDNVNPERASKIAIAFLKEILPFSNNFRAIIGYDGPLYVFDVFSKNAGMLKGRIVGLLYDSLAMIITGLKQGQLFVTYEMAKIITKNLDLFNFVEFHFADQTKMKLSALNDVVLRRL